MLDHDLGRAMALALAIPGARCLEHAGRFSWRRCAEQFLGHLHPIDIEASQSARPAATG
jgi:hypothetical protein